ncbi:protein of unknown function (plasmid) [Caballeronia sp. S22]
MATIDRLLIEAKARRVGNMFLGHDTRFRTTTMRLGKVLEGAVARRVEARIPVRHFSCG